MVVTRSILTHREICINPSGHIGRLVINEYSAILGRGRFLDYNSVRYVDAAPNMEWRDLNLFRDVADPIDAVSLIRPRNDQSRRRGCVCLGELSLEGFSSATDLRDVNGPAPRQAIN